MARAPRDQTRAVLLAALLGDLGLHHFYLRRPYLGLLSLAFCWTGIPGVFASLDAWRYAFMHAHAWAERHNGGRLGKPVPRWLRPALALMPVAILVAIFGMLYAGYDF